MSSAVVVPAIGATGSLAAIMIVCVLGGLILSICEKVAAKRRSSHH